MNERDALPVLRLTGEQIGSITPEPDGDWFVDFDEYEEFVPKRLYDAALATTSEPDTDGDDWAADDECPKCGRPWPAPAPPEPTAGLDALRDIEDELLRHVNLVLTQERGQAILAVVRASLAAQPEPTAGLEEAIERLTKFEMADWPGQEFLLYDDVAALAAAPSAPEPGIDVELPLPELGCECGACRYLRRKQKEQA